MGDRVGWGRVGWRRGIGIWGERVGIGWGETQTTGVRSGEAGVLDRPWAGVAGVEGSDNGCQWGLGSRDEGGGDGSCNNSACTSMATERGMQSRLNQAPALNHRVTSLRREGG